MDAGPSKTCPEQNVHGRESLSEPHYCMGSATIVNLSTGRHSALGMELYG